MSSHGSDSEKAPSNHSESPDQEQSEDGRLPEHNPSSIRNNATTSSSSTAKKAQKKPKKTSAAPSDDDFADDTADVQTPAARPNTDTRPGGGFVNPNSARPKSRKMRWTAENDRHLLIFGLGRDVSGKQYEAIANSFPEQPTPKAVQERLTKLRVICREYLKKSGIYDPDVDESRRELGALRSRSTDHADSSPPLDLPPKKKQTRQSAASSTSLAQPPPPPQGGASNLGRFQPPPLAPGLNAPSHLAHLFSPVPPGRGRGPPLPPNPFPTAGVSNVQSLGPMGSQPAFSPHASIPNVGMAQMGAGQYQPYPSWSLPHNARHQNAPVYPGGGASTARNSFQDPPYGLTDEQLGLPSHFTNLPAGIPAGPPVNPSVPDAEEPAEEYAEEDAEGEDEEDAEGEDEEEDPLVSSARDLQAKRAQREAERRAFK